MNFKKTEANYTPLTPISFLERTAKIFPNYISIITENKKFTWKETYERSVLLASSLIKKNIKVGDVVSIMAPNSNAIYEAHFAIPMSGAVINTINIRLEPKTISFIIRHSKTKLIFVDTEFLPVIRAALKIGKHQVTLIAIKDDKKFSKNLINEKTYESFVQEGKKNTLTKFKIKDEWSPISLSYTSGTTSKPKGVVTHHRGAYLNAISNQLAWNMRKNPTYLWTLPMFHCNGWCFPWTIAALAGKNICLRKVNAKKIFELIRKHKVTHLCGTTVIINLLIEEGIKLKKKVEFMTGAAPPPSSVLKKIDEQGFNITHTYGLTEVYGPAVVCEWQNNWNKLKKKKIAELKSRQGVKYPGVAQIKIFNKRTKKEVKHNGKELGEVCIKGNTVMMGYHLDRAATKKVFYKGWFHTGDIGVTHKNGYIELKDRLKDIIISGGENISSIEIENVLFKLKDVVDVAVVAKKDEKWGEVPCAFITLKKNSVLEESRIIDFCKKNMAKFKIPKKIIFGKIGKTSTGKIQKYLLRKIVNQTK
ncbi:AMP-binding protein [Candidatus Pelagibacter bacterium]|nr:AMP-binding protein [Candidatus Pelagibacter bacterium]